MPSVLITGANRGIGLAFARSFAADGWRVHACCRNPDGAEDLAALSADMAGADMAGADTAGADTAGAVTLYRLDVTDGPRIAGLSRELADEAIDVLVNNAGVMGPRTGFGEIDYDGWLPVFETNTLAPMRMAEGFVEQVAKSGRKLIVNISSIMGSLGENAGGGAIIYRSSKAALNMVSKGLSVELAARGITVIVFHPGWVSTDMGGPNAAVTPGESVEGMRAVIEGVTPDDSGRFFNFDGREIQW
jgi:NAD(P)-dependent dehydrogenase (short-subunit alcohol dehydrogenase family)